MFFTKKKTISLVALLGAATFTLTACAEAQVTANPEGLIDKNIKSGYVEESKTSIQSMEPAFILLLNEYYKSGKTVEEILSKEDSSSVLYSSALYVKLREFGLNDETILKELYNVINFGLVHTYPDGWKNDLLVENLNKSIDYSDDAIVYYYPLAAYVHLFGCKLDHEVIDDRISCGKINEDLMDMNENILFANYVDENILAMEDDHPLKIALNRIINSKEDTEVCIYELNRVYELAMIPRCATKEEWASIGHLVKTLDEEENPCEYYYPLACVVHTLRCEEEHYENEFGQLECPTIRKEMESGLSLGK